jgi:predicted helicase
VHFTRQKIWEAVSKLDNLGATVARKEFDLGKDGRDWTVAGAKADIRESGPNKNYVTPILYRPMDVRYTYWTGKTKGFLAYPRREVMQHVVHKHNIGLIFNRQIVGDEVNHFSVSPYPICHGTFYLGNKGQDYFAPIYLYREGELVSADDTSEVNFTKQFRKQFADAVGLAFSKLAPRDVLGYMLAVFSSEKFRSRYSELLKLDFPRLPLPASQGLFTALAKLGSQLIALHLLDEKGATALADPKDVRFAGRGAANVEKGYPKWDNGRVAINAERWFEEVPENVWSFHIGGYQVCEKWLKDRRIDKLGRPLNDGEILHYRRIVTAISEAIGLMAEIDRVIDRHGGWPGAFKGMAD